MVREILGECHRRFGHVPRGSSDISNKLVPTLLCTCLCWDERPMFAVQRFFPCAFGKDYGQKRNEVVLIMKLLPLPLGLLRTLNTNAKAHHREDPCLA